MPAPSASSRAPRCRPLLALASAAALFSSAPSQSADGVLEINHTCAIQTGCFSGDAPLLPVTIDGTAGRSYRLTSDLLVLDANTDVISISASDVSLDLAGFRIQGPNTCSGTPTTCTLPGTGDGVVVTSLTSVSGVEVAHGSVIGMSGRGISLGPKGAVRDVRASQNRSFGISATLDATVSGSTASSNGLTGISAGDRLNVTGSTASLNGGNGITAGASATVSSSTASNNGGFGLDVGDASNVTSCAVSFNGSVGIIVGNGAHVTGCTASNNAGQGISMGTASTVSASTVSHNSALGIFANTGSTVSASTVSGNLSEGIFFIGGGSSVVGCNVSNNGLVGIQTAPGSLVIGSVVRDNGDGGLKLGDDSAYRENAITSNAGAPVVINGGGTFANLGDNFCTDNANSTVACP